MRSVNIHEAKTHFSRLVDQASAGEEILIARAGKPVARLVPLEASVAPDRRLGLGRGRFSVPDDVDHGYTHEVEAMFNTDDHVALR